MILCLKAWESRTLPSLSSEFESFSDLFLTIKKTSFTKYHLLLYINCTNYFANDPTLSKLSSNYDITKLPEDFQNSARQITSDQNFILILLDKMFNHDSKIAYSMYKILYEGSHLELIIGDGAMFLDEQLTESYINKGGNLAALTEMNAELWINSPVEEVYLTIDNT